MEKMAKWECFNLRLTNATRAELDRLSSQFGLSGAAVVARALRYVSRPPVARAVFGIPLGAKAHDEPAKV